MPSSNPFVGKKKVEESDDGRWPLSRRKKGGRGLNKGQETVPNVAMALPNFTLGERRLGRDETAVQRYYNNRANPSEVFSLFSFDLRECGNVI